MSERYWPVGTPTDLKERWRHREGFVVIVQEHETEQARLKIAILSTRGKEDNHANSLLL